jgi:iron complex outermembrane receptor protein
MNKKILLLSGASLALQSGYGFAADDSEIQTVTVTAQKREEKLQDIPAAATAITESDIVNAGINTIQDVAALTPNLVIIDQLRPGIQTVSFRGFTTVQGGQSPFAIVVDGVPQPGQEFLKQQLIDVQQIEVLRGPQGTLYGAGAVAGAINVVTKEPTNEFEASAKLGYAEGNQSTGTLTVSGPIVDDKLLFRASAYSNTFDGLIDNPAGREHVDFAKERSFSGELLFKPTENLDIDLRGHATNGTYGALWLVLVTNDQFDDFRQGPEEDIDGIDNRHLQTFSAKVDYRLADLTLTSITAYNDAEQYAVADGDFSAASVFAQTWRNDTNAWSQEFRLTSGDAGPLKWNLGLFGQDYRVEDATSFYSVDPSAPFASLSDDHYHYKSGAVFGQGTYDFTSQWSATVGGRYDRVKADVNDVQAGEQDSHTFSEFQPKATLAYKWTPELMGYVTYSKGFRTGGFNPSTPLSLRLYENETSTNYEIGVKTTLLDNHLSINAAAFHTDFEDQQFFFSQATTEGIFRAIINIPKTRVNGAELEVQARPNEWLRLLASLGYNDTSIQRFVDNSFNGKRTPQVYGFTGTTSAEVSQNIGSFKLVSRVDYEHRGDVYWDLPNQLRTPSKDFVNARVAFERDDGVWSLAVFSHNLTNERTPAAVGANAFGAGLTLRSANEPRQTGVELIARF